jgi:hypothetical protein
MCLRVAGVLVAAGVSFSCKTAAPKPPTAPSPPADLKGDRWEQRTLVNRRVRYSVPSYWVQRRFASTIIDETQAPFTAGMWYTFPFPWPEGEDPEFGITELFDKDKVLVNLEFWLMTSPRETLAEFSERRRRPLPTHERIISDSMRKGARVIVRHATNGPVTNEQFLCFKVSGRVAMALLTAYTVEPKPPPPWLDATRAEIERVCRSIKIEKPD